MKLKKIASLALAGVMAVSMLAGCAGNNNSNSGNTDGDDIEVIPTSAVVDIFNKGQDVAAKAQVEFTADSSFEQKVVAAIEEMGTSAIAANSATTLANNLKLLTGISYSTATIKTASASTVGFLDASVSETDAAKYDGVVNSFVGVNVVAYNTSTVASPEAAAKAAMTDVNTFIGKLADTTKNSTTTNPGDDYLNYTYTGNVCAVAANTTTGAPIYVVAYVINQNVALETAPEV